MIEDRTNKLGVKVDSKKAIKIIDKALKKQEKKKLMSRGITRSSSSAIEKHQ